MSKKKESPNKYEKALADSLSEWLESRNEQIERMRDEINKTKPNTPNAVELANKNYKLVECECVLPSTNLIQEDAKPATKCSSKNCCKDEIKMLRKELSDLRRSYNGYRGAMKQADRERDAKVMELANDISIHDNCIMSLHGRLEGLEENDPTSLFRKRDLIWGVAICITVVVLALISAYFR